MALNLDALSNWDPHGFIDTELGRIAVFELSAGADSDLQLAAQRVDSPVEFARHLARFTCFPSDHLRDGKYRPKEPAFGIEEISALSESSLAQIARFFVNDVSRDEADPLDEEQVLSLLMTQFRDDWKKRSKMLQDALSPFRGLGDGYLAIDSQIKSLNKEIIGGVRGTLQKSTGSSLEVTRLNTNLADAMRDIAGMQDSRWGLVADAAADLEEIRESIKDTTSALQQVAAIQQAMNAQGRQHVEAEELQRLITRGQNRLVVWLTGITLAATVFVGPASRLACAASSSTKIFTPIPVLGVAAKIICGY
jgi:hypothetical protein